MVNNIINVRNGNTTPVGFKHSEIGIFPKNWEVVPLVNICKEIGDGIHATPIYSESGEYYFINGNNISNGKVFTDDNTKKVNKSEFLKHQKKLTKKTILLSINGTIGNTAFYKEERLVLGKSAAYLTIKDNVSEEFIYYIIQTSQTKKQFDDGMTGSTIKNLGLATIRKTIVPLPTIEEQTAIASALSDTDALINALEQLIAKKQAIKTATMQHLLTGRTRLPQFAKHPDGTLKGYKSCEAGLIPDDWDCIYLNSLVSVLDAGVSVNSLDGADIFSHGKHILKTSCVNNGCFDANEKKSILPIDVTRAKCSPVKGGIIISRMNTPALVGEIGYVAEDEPCIFLPDRLWQMKLRKDVDNNPRWLAYLLSFPFFSHKIKEAATGTSGSMKNISKDSLLSLQIPLPKPQEQIAIATILSDMDAELEVLEQKLAKVRDIKQGMMQQLLTGRIRLPLDQQP